MKLAFIPTLLPPTISGVGVRFGLLLCCGLALMGCEVTRDPQPPGNTYQMRRQSAPKRSSRPVDEDAGTGRRGGREGMDYHIGPIAE